MKKKRAYNSTARQALAEETRQRILTASRKLFTNQGFEATTLDQIAELAAVSTPTVYGIFRSKAGILHELVSATLFGETYLELVQESKNQTDPLISLQLAARISRTIYDAERGTMSFIRGAGAISLDLKKLEKLGEKQRYERQEFVVQRLADAGLLAAELSVQQARDLLWTLTGRDLYRMLVMERGWSADVYEKWLSRMLQQSLVKPQVNN